MLIDFLIFNGNFIVLNGEAYYNWLAIDNGIIIDAGYGRGYDKYSENCKESMDIGGKFVIPGFYDSHTHFVQTAIKSISLDLSEAKNYMEIGGLIGEWISKNPHDSIIRAFGLNITELEEKSMPDRRILDLYSKDYALWINSKDFHVSILNTKAFHSLKIPLVMDGVKYNSSGLPTGVVTGKANAFIRKKVLQTFKEEEKYKAIVGLIENSIVAHGVTTVNAMEGGYVFFDDDAELIYNIRDSLPIDVILFYSTTDLNKILKLKLKRVGGDIFVDGSFASMTAALTDNYMGAEKNGTLFFTQRELDDFILECYQNNLQTAVHAIGERAIEQVLCAHENARRMYPGKTMRHRVEHGELLSNGQMKRAKDLGLIFSVQPTYEHIWGGEGKMYEERLGERYKNTNPFKEMIEAGLVLCGGSDSDLTPIDPILGIHSAVNHPVIGHSISVREALKMFTINAAYAVNEEQFKGSIEVGKIADLVVIDKNIMEIPKEEIKAVEVLYTIKDGVIIYRAEI